MAPTLPSPSSAAFSFLRHEYHDPNSPNYNPAPSRNAVWVVLAVFGSFALCFLAVAGWIRCVEIVERARSPLLRSSSARYDARKQPRIGLGGFQEWYQRRGRQRPSSPPVLNKPWLRPTDTEFWRTYQTPGFEVDFAPSPLIIGNEGSGGYRTFERDIPARVRTSGEEEEETVLGFSPTSQPRPSMLRMSSWNSGPLKRELGVRKSWANPSMAGLGSKASKGGRKLKGRWGGADGEELARKRRRSLGKLAARRVMVNNDSGGTGGPGLPRSWSTGGIRCYGRTLDVVLEEGGTSPERC